MLARRGWIGKRRGGPARRPARAVPGDLHGVHGFTAARGEFTSDEQVCRVGQTRFVKLRYCGMILDGYGGTDKAQKPSLIWRSAR